MLYTKLLLRRLACVPWLLAAGLVLGWSGKAAAQDVNISLAVDPTVISEDAGATDVVVTATLDGKVFDDDVVVILVTDNESTAIRDVDYTARMSNLTISAGSVSGTTTITITPYNDKRARGDKTIRLTGWYANNTVGTVDITLKDVGASSVLSFDTDAAIYDRTYIVGRPIADWLPEASGGIGELTYSVLGLPADLSFDPATRTISGTPTAATDGAVTVTYKVTDEGGATIRQTFTIEIVIIVEDATISLMAAPTVISEDAGPTDVVVTATLDGKVFDDDVTVFLRIDNESTAIRDVDYTAILRRLTIPAGSASGTTTITITPRNDKSVGASKTIRLTGTYANTVVPVDITLKDADGVGVGGSAFSFPADAVIDDYKYTAGTAITDLVLPEASGGTGELTYSVSALPTGLSFNAATRTITGTPSETGAVTVVYTATDEDGTTDALAFTIAVRPEFEDNFDPSLDLSSEEAGATEPEEPEELEGPSLAFADDAAINDYRYTAGTAIAALVLPEASGGTGELTYSVSALPVGLSFDAATRTITGTPSETGAVTVVYTATDEDGTTDALAFTIAVRIRPEFDDFGSSLDLFSGGTEAEESEESEELSPAFAADAAIDDQVYTAGTAIADLVLPEASGGTGELTYSVSTLPAGLAFDAATRTFSGTPTAATDGAVDVIYTATDEDGTTDALTFTITVNPPLSFDTLLDLFGAGKVVPTASRD